jgi:hypothetical protein
MKGNIYFVWKKVIAKFENFSLIYSCFVIKTLQLNLMVKKEKKFLFKNLDQKY